MEETQRKVTNVKFPKTLAAKRWQKGENQNSLSRGDDFQLIGLRQETAADGGLRQRWRDSTADTKNGEDTNIYIYIRNTV